TIADLAPRLLAEEAKDLEAAVYLTEALLRLHGFRGLTAGFRLIRELVQGYWEHLYPMPDEDGLETRLAHVYGLNGKDSEGTLIRPILMTGLTGGQSVTPCSTAVYQHARAFEALTPEERSRRADDSSLTMKDVETAVAETPPDEFRRIHQEIEECQTEFQAMSAAFAEVCGEDAPHTSSIREALATCLETLKYIAGNTAEKPEAETDAEQLAGDTEDDSSEETSGQAPAKPKGKAISGEIQSRQQALELVGKVAVWFRHHEPHSPLSFAADQLVRWGKMSLPELLEEAIPDDHARSHLFLLMGIPSEHRS
ncbi:MAG: type VI secretion system protein TssA, partial [Planctomycetaceae bacterium]|nr:type VI secretion system protein TssA [Planctomycetaceae bacterium]